MTIVRLSGGLTPGDGSDPRTFPEIFNAAADVIEATQGSAVALGSAVASQGSAITALEDLNPVQFGTAVPSDGQVLTFSTAVAGYVPEDVDAGGKILQVVSTAKTDTFSASLAAAGTAAITGLSASITPSATSSKVLVTVTVNGSNSLNLGTSVFRILRGATLIGAGDTASDRGRISSYSYGSTDGAGMSSSTFTFLDTPNTTSSTTYSVEAFQPYGGTFTVYVNRTNSDTDQARFTRAASSITLMEVAA
jgi:hypothetical protein